MPSRFPLGTIAALGYGGKTMHLTYDRLIRPLCARARSRVALGAIPFSQLFWLLMLGAHTPALIGAWRSLGASGGTVGRVGGCIVLTLSMAFFALKVRDIALLRIRPDRRTWVAIFLVVALLHLDAINASHNVAIAPEYTLLVAGTLAACKAISVFRRHRQARPHSASSSVHLSSLMRSADTAWFDTFRPRCWVLAFRAFELRGPPA